MYKGCRPNTPITAAFDVLDETRKMYLQYFICTASIGPAYFVPQISAPYIKIGKTILSKRSKLLCRLVMVMFVKRLYSRALTKTSFRDICNMWHTILRVIKRGYCSRFTKKIRAHSRFTKKIRAQSRFTRIINTFIQHVLSIHETCIWQYT